MTVILGSCLIIGCTCVAKKTNEKSKLREDLLVAFATISIVGTLVIAGNWYCLENWDIRGTTLTVPHIPKGL